MAGILQALLVAAGNSVTWNPSDKSAGITLSGGNLVATSNVGAAWKSVRAITSKSAGKYYFEARVTGGGSVVLGVGTSSATLASYCGVDTAGYGYYSDTGEVLNNAVPVAGYDTYVLNDYVCIALDLTNARIWFRKNGGDWNGNPAANPATNSLGLAVTAGTYFPMMSGFAVGDAMTGNFGSSAFAYTKPSGFSSWNAA